MSDNEPAAFGARTLFRVDTCTTESSGFLPNWNALRVQAEKWSEMHGLCGQTPRATTYTQASVTVGQADYCNHGATVNDAYAYSTNESQRNPGGSWAYKTPFTPTVTTK